MATRRRVGRERREGGEGEKIEGRERDETELTPSFKA